MADLYNLLDELEEQQEQEERLQLAGDEDGDDDDDEVDQNGGKPGRESIETAVTAPMMSEEWDSPQQVEVPLALKEAAEKKHRLLDGEEEAGMKDHFLRHFEDGEYEQQEQQTQQETNELAAKLHRIWLQERHCPEILPYEDEMVEQVKEQLEERQDVIDELETNTSSDSSSAVDALMANLAQLDHDRTKFILTDWLHTRLEKVEAHPLYMREKLDHMSDAEIAYLKQYGAMMEEYLRQTVLDHIPEAWQSLDEASMIDKPDYDSYHFWVAKETIVIEDHGVEHEHEKGACLVAKYRAMSENMKNGKVDLLL